MCLMLFLTGLVLDALIALYTRAIAHGQAMMAAALSAALTVLNLLVLDAVLTGHNWLGALAFVAGGSLGSYWAVARGRRK